MFRKTKMPKRVADSSKLYLAINMIEYRKENNYSRETFSEICDVCLRQVTNMEKCKVAITLDTLDKIAAGTNLSTEYWITDHREK
ncbi:MAG: helix-turn-helix transcriptional regulator [Clostridia bacterium]|nr:helix-turn-helix transcriptional regulator [Clostridia bacterium]